MISPIVDQAWLGEHGSTVIVADVRWYLDGRSGFDAYVRGHLRGAVFVDLESVLARRGSREEGRHPLPEPDQFATDMGQLGIGDDDVVVAYDDAGGVIAAARLVWMLRATGRSAALLDGGITAFAGVLETAVCSRPPATFTSRPWPERLIASIDDAMAPGSVVLDARDGSRYRGEEEPVDSRPGHIPRARSVPCRENLRGDATFRGRDELRRRFEQFGVVDGADVVSYCGSGVTACHNLLAMEFAGLGIGRLYPGSWSQYSARGELPVAVGGEP